MKKLSIIVLILTFVIIEVALAETELSRIEHGSSVYVLTYFQTDPSDAAEYGFKLQLYRDGVPCVYVTLATLRNATLPDVMNSFREGLDKINEWFRANADMNSPTTPIDVWIAAMEKLVLSISLEIVDGIPRAVGTEQEV